MKHTIENAHLSLVFDERSATVVSLLNRQTGEAYIKHAAKRPLFRLWTQRRGTTERVACADERVRLVACRVEAGAGAAANADEPALLLEFAVDAAEESGAPAGEGSAGEAIGVSVRIALSGGESVWSLEVRNHDAAADVVEVLFPYVCGIGLGDSWEDDCLLYPHHAGERTLNPVREYASDKYRNFWRAQVFAGDDCYYREINYCGLASMTWMYLHDADHGLYFASHDERFPLTGLRVETGGPEQPWMGFGFRKYPTVGTGQSWHSGEACIALTGRDWHWGAKRYRRWIDRHIAMPRHPDFLHDEYILNQCYNFKRRQHIENRFADIPAMFDHGAKTFGMRHMFMASWNRKGFDRDYPEFQPDMELGTPWELYEGCRYINEHNGFATFYINVRIFDVDSDFFPSLGKRWAIKDHAQQMMHEEYGPTGFVVLCPSHADWQDYIIDMARWMVRSYGATGIYLDQLGSADPYPCYDAGHSHAGADAFNTGYLRVLRDLLPEMRKLNPDSFLMIENCGDIYGSYVWGNLTWNGEKYDEFFNMYKYTFPEYVQVNMVNPRRDYSGEAQALKLRQDTARAMLLGSVFWVGTDKFADADDPMYAFIDKAIRLRKRLQPLVRNGVYLDGEGIAAIRADGEAAVSHWQLEPDAHLYVIGNLQRSRGYFEIDRPDGGASGADQLRVRYADMDGGEGDAHWELRGDRLRIAVPEAELSFVTVQAG